MTNAQAALIAAASQLSIALYVGDNGELRGTGDTLALAENYKSWLDQKDAKDAAEMRVAMEKQSHRPRIDEES